MDVYVIHCTKHTERLVNIEHHLKRLFPELKIWEGTYITHSVDDVEKEMQVYAPELRIKNKNIFKTVGELGCYLSHYSLLKHIKQQQSSSKYTLIFEDDAMLKQDVTEIQEKLEKVKFDIFYLGLNIHNKGANICDNIYSIDPGMLVPGAHAYIINNASIDKIHQSILCPIGPIDYQYELFIKNKTINAVVVYPYFCIQDRESFYSTIKKQGNHVVHRKKKNIEIHTNKLVYNDKIQRNVRNNVRLEKLTTPQPSPCTNNVDKSNKVCVRMRTKRRH